MAISSQKKWPLIVPFFLILLLHMLAIFFFTRGFLLTRTELSAFSSCTDTSQSPCSSISPIQNLTGFHPNVSKNSGDLRCWTKPAVDRLVIIVLDALRIDFVAPSAFFGETKPWMDKLQVLQKLASEERSSTRIFKAIADPPTTSLQRMKGLTTGGLPTFIDVGNSFGAPAITEDNLIKQLVKNGKRVLMMGDDTWLQLFPDHFEKSYPFPSFNVKDLHTVDDGCVEHLFPSLYRDDWDVLIAHFLGVDHAGHIFGVDSIPMIEKLEQYNIILEKVIEILKKQSGPGDLHENTFLVVMGDHGQTLNGDHGGGTPEEVETSLFAMSLKKPSDSISSIFDTSSCKFNAERKETCISTIQQLDFAVTMATLLGIPFPFGSIGRVNPELYAMGAGTWDEVNMSAANSNCCTDLELWMQNYVNVLCTNCWQVKRYIDLYSSSSVIGFSKNDLLHVEEQYAQAQDGWSNNVKRRPLFENGSPTESCESSLSVLQGQIGIYTNFLQSVAELARSKWTEFDLKMMGLGLCILFVSILIQFSSIRMVNKLFYVFDPYVGYPGISVKFICAVFLVAIRACSFLSNSYILSEGKVANFLLATTGFLNLRYSIMEEKMRVEAIAFLLLNCIHGFSTEHGISKQAIGLTFLDHSIWSPLSEVAPILCLVFLAVLLYRIVVENSCWRFWKYIVIGGVILSYILIAISWTFESNVMGFKLVLKGIDKNFIPRMVYAIGFGLLVVLVFAQRFEQNKRTSDYRERAIIATVSMISVWSPTLMILLGRQGPLTILIFLAGVWCVTRLQKVVEYTTDGSGLGAFDPMSVTQLSLLAVCLFFYTGHWCTFDGLRYGAAFVGFDEFNLFRQGVLLTIDTFGVSHILPIFSLPLLVAFQNPNPRSGRGREILFTNLTKVFLTYGVITAVTTTFTMICVAIQRRHLMVSPSMNLIFYIVNFYGGRLLLPTSRILLKCIESKIFHLILLRVQMVKFLKEHISSDPPPQFWRFG